MVVIIAGTHTDLIGVLHQRPIYQNMGKGDMTAAAGAKGQKQGQRSRVWE